MAFSRGKNGKRIEYQGQQGVTIIELLVVVVIIGILATIAYPSYQNYTKSTRRTDAMNALTEAAARQEKFFATCNTYAGNLTGTTLDCATGKLGFSTTAQGYYTLGVAAGSLTGVCSGGGAAITCGFTITATPVATGPQNGDGKLRIDSIGKKEWDKANNNSFTAKWTDK